MSHLESQVTLSCCTTQSVICILEPVNQGLITGIQKGNCRSVRIWRNLSPCALVWLLDLRTVDLSRWRGHRFISVYQVTIVRPRWSTVHIVKVMYNRTRFCPLGNRNKNKLHYRQFEKHGSGVHVWTFFFIASIDVCMHTLVYMPTKVAVFPSTWKRTKPPQICFGQSRNCPLSHNLP